MEVCQISSEISGCFSDFSYVDGKICGIDILSNSSYCFTEIDTFSKDFYYVSEDGVYRFFDYFGMSYFDFLSFTAQSSVFLGFIFVFLSSFLIILLGRR